MSFFHCYKPHRFNSSSRETIDRANEVISDMSSQGYVMNLRQLFYVFVSRDWLENKDKEYKRLGRLLTSARMAGETDWYAIEDVGRQAHQTYSEESPENIVDGIEYNISFDQWERQDNYLEVWVEKQALENVIKKPCARFDVTYMACKGYLSASEAWRAGLRFQEAKEKGKNCTLIHLADHDPSGLNMTSDNRNRVRLFAETNDIDVRRIALNMEQVELYKPPPNPTKQTDSRASAYMKEFGTKSWELDALTPKVLDELIASTINEYRDMTTWSKVLEEEEYTRKPLAALSENWTEVQNFMREKGLI